MHEYTLAHHDRKNTYYVIAVIGGVLGSIFTALIDRLAGLGLIISGPSGLLVFTLVFLLFDHCIWKWPKLYSLGVVKIPNLNGSWDARIHSDKNRQHGIPANVIIHQTYSKMRIRLKTDKSTSLSTMANLDMADPKFYKLRYEYIAEFRSDDDPDIKRHYGVTNIDLISESDKFSEPQQASYYTELMRDSNGRIQLTKAEVAK